MKDILFHCGCLVLLETKVEKIVGSILTTVLVSLFQFSDLTRCFKKRKYCIEQLQLEGCWNIVKFSSADCHTTGVLQPCIVLSSHSKADKSSSICYALYQLRDLKKFVKVFCTKCINCNNLVKLCNGPSLFIIDFQMRNTLCFSKFRDELMELSTSITKFNSVLAFNNIWEDDCLKCQFLSNIPNVYEKAVDSFQTLRSESYHWVYVTVLCNFIDSKINVNYKMCNQIPSSYCLFATDVIFGIDEDCTKFLFSSRCQAIAVKNGKVLNICEIPFSFPDYVYIVGEHAYKVIIISNQQEKKACAIQTETFDVAKTWDGINHVACGTSTINGNPCSCVILVHSNLNLSTIEEEDFQMIFDLTDVVKKPEKPVEEFKVELSKYEMSDVDFDLFSMPNSDVRKYKEYEILTKVTNSLEQSMNKHKVSVGHLRQQLSHYDSAISASANALCYMNNNIHLINSEVRCQRTCSDGLIEVFSTSNKTILNQPRENKELLILKKSWERIIFQDWIIGFHLKNTSQKWLSNFAVILPNSSMEKAKFTNHTRIFKQTCFQEPIKSVDGTVQMENHIAPGEDFTVATQIDLSALCKLHQNCIVLSVAIAASVKNFSTDGDGSTVEQYVFHAGSFSFMQSEVAANALGVDLKNLIISNDGCYSDDIIAIRASHKSEKIFTILSANADVISICLEVLQSVGFKYSAHANAYICCNVGSLYLVLVKLDKKSLTMAEGTISSKSDLEFKLLLNYFKEQVWNEIEISTKLPSTG